MEIQAGSGYAAAMSEAIDLVGHPKYVQVQGAIHRVKIRANDTRNGRDLEVTAELKEDLRTIKLAMNKERALQLAGTIVYKTDKTWAPLLDWTLSPRKDPLNGVAVCTSM